MNNDRELLSEVTKDVARRFDGSSEMWSMLGNLLCRPVGIFPSSQTSYTGCG